MSSTTLKLPLHGRPIRTTFLYLMKMAWNYHMLMPLTLAVVMAIFNCRVRIRVGHTPRQDIHDELFLAFNEARRVDLNVLDLEEMSDDGLMHEMENMGDIELDAEDYDDDSDEYDEVDEHSYDSDSNSIYFS